MAISISKLNSLGEGSSQRVKGQLTLEDFKKGYEAKAKELQIPIEFETDQVSSGCLGLTKQDCLVIFHPEHKTGWGKICLRLTTQGVYTVADFTQITGFGIQHLITNTGKDLKSGGSLIRAAVLKGITAKANSDMQNWHDALFIILDEAKIGE